MACRDTIKQPAMHLQQWCQQQRESILQRLGDGSTDALPQDSACTFRAGAGSGHFVCRHCQQLREVAQVRGHGSLVYLDSGPLAGQTLRVLVRHQRAVVSSRGGHLLSNGAATAALVPLVIHQHLQAQYLPHSPQVLCAFVCGHSTCTVQQLCFPVPWQHLQAHDVVGIWQQLAAMTDALQDVQFVHGAPCAHRLALRDEPVGYRYRDMEVSCRYTVIMHDYEHSSVLYSGRRIGPQPTTVREERLLRAPASDTYALNHNVDGIVQAMRSGWRRPSLEWYVWMVSLAARPQWRQLLLSHTVLQRAWEALWYPGQRALMEQRLHSLQEADTYAAVALLVGVRLRSDAVQRVMCALSASAV